MIKSKKEDGGMVMFTPDSTKELIFDTAISLFSQFGYDAVSIRDLAAKVGIKGASIYNHYDSKQEILDHIYEYFERNMYLASPSREEMETRVAAGDLETVIKAITSRDNYSDDEKLIKRMMAIIKIIFSRMFSDDKAAAELYRRAKRESRELIEAYLNCAVEMGRLKPFDTKGFARVFIALHADVVAGEYTKDCGIADEFPEIELVNALICDALRPMEMK